MLNSGIEKWRNEHSEEPGGGTTTSPQHLDECGHCVSPPHGCLRLMQMPLFCTFYLFSLLWFDPLTDLLDAARHARMLPAIFIHLCSACIGVGDYPVLGFSTVRRNVIKFVSCVV